MKTSAVKNKKKKKKKKKAKRKATKQPTITGMKKKLWAVFSKYIRMRDCLEVTKTLTSGKCCTCGRSYPISKLQAGHFIPGRADSILFEPTCVHSQCYRCNVLRQGEWVKYFRYMERKYGLGHINRLMTLSEEEREITPEWAAIALNYYQEQILKMEAEHGR